jgi:hypothetical protein
LLNKIDHLCAEHNRLRIIPLGKGGGAGDGHARRATEHVQTIVEGWGRGMVPKHPWRYRGCLGGLS